MARQLHRRPVIHNFDYLHPPGWQIIALYKSRQIANLLLSIGFSLQYQCVTFFTRGRHSTAYQWMHLNNHRTIYPHVKTSHPNFDLKAQNLWKNSKQLLQQWTHIRSCFFPTLQLRSSCFLLQINTDHRSDQPASLIGLSLPLAATGPESKLFCCCCIVPRPSDCSMRLKACTIIVKEGSAWPGGRRVWQLKWDLKRAKRLKERHLDRRLVKKRKLSLKTAAW